MENKHTKTSFREATKITRSFNNIVEWNEYTIVVVGWHHLMWKLVPRGTSFEEVVDREYDPIAQFHTQEELWQFIKEKIELSSAV